MFSPAVAARSQGADPPIAVIEALHRNGLNGAEVKSNLSKAPELKITSFDPSVWGIDQRNFAFVDEKLGRVEIRISCGDASIVEKGVVYSIAPDYWAPMARPRR